MVSQNYLRLIICLGVLLFTKTAFAQFQIQHYTTENGLPSNGIKGLQFDDSTGFLWIATEAGLVRYNGMRFKTFDVKTNPELGSNRIVVLTKNAAGKILMCGQEGNLSLVKNNTAAFYFRGSQLAKYNFNHYGAVAASDTLFRQCFKNPWTRIPYSTQETKTIMLSDTACVLFNKKELYYYSISTIQPQLVKPTAHNIKSLFQIEKQLYYLDSLNQLFAFDLYTGQLRKQEAVDANGKSFTLEHESSKLLWQSGMESAIFLQQGKAWIIGKTNERQLQFRLIASGLPENVFYNFAQYKREGNCLFLGSASQGIFVVYSNRLNIKQPAADLTTQSNSLYSQIELPNGNVVTSEGLIIGDAAEEYDYGLGNGFFKSVYNLNDTVLIFGTKDSIFSYNKNTYRRQLITTKHVVSNFAMDSVDSHLYYADQDGIAAVNSKGLNFLRYFDKKTSAGLLIVSMIQVAPHKLALATCEGLLGFDTETKIIDTLLKLPAICFRSFFREGKYLFIGSYGGGFYIMKNGIIKAMPLDVNQYLKYTHCFIKDASGFCWISTNNGLFKAKMSDMIEAYERDLPQVYYHHFGKEDGMEITEMNGGCTPCALKLKSGMFSFPTMNGLVWVDPLHNNMVLPSGGIYMDKIMVDGKEMELNAGIIPFPEGKKKIDLFFAINGWCKKENLYIDYKLNDDKWLPVEIASGDVKISLANLSHGSYKLSIRKMNGFGINNYSYSNLAFIIATPFYYTWWFRIMILLALAGMGYLIFKWRINHYAVRDRKLTALVDEKTLDLNVKNQELEKNNLIKMRLISIISHDIMTPLRFMHYAGKALVENGGAIKPEEQQETIVEITQTAKDMEMLSAQILNWIIYQGPNQRMEKEEFNLHQLVEMIFRVLQFSAKEKQTKLNNDIPLNFVVCQYLEPLRVLIYNLVLNSLNFTREGTVNVGCNNAGDVVKLQVTDTGLGMTKVQLDNLLRDERIVASLNVDNKKGTGLGYLIIKDLLEMMKGSLDIKSNKNEGTVVMVKLPIM